MVRYFCAGARPRGDDLAAKVPTSERIVKTVGTCGGKARIAGHRIRVSDVVAWHERQGMSVDEIVAQFPSLTTRTFISPLRITSTTSKRSGWKCERKRQSPKSTAGIIRRWSKLDLNKSVGRSLLKSADPISPRRESRLVSVALDMSRLRILGEGERCEA
jgi:uncharacterized protein (DUF433 family)